MVHLLNTVIFFFNIKEIGENGLKIIENAVYFLYVSYILREKRADITSVVLLFQEY